MRQTAHVIFLSVALLAASTHASAQDPHAPSAQQSPLRVYLDCGRCDFDHLRREVPIVDYVRDRADADVHVLVTFQETGAGGDEFTFHFLGIGPLEGHADTLRYVSQQVQTEDEVRDGYTRTFGLGLVRHLLLRRAHALRPDLGDPPPA